MTLPDPGEYLAQNATQTTYLKERYGFSRLTNQQLKNMEGMVRMFPTMGADVAIGTALHLQEQEDFSTAPWIKDLAQRDAVAQDTSFRAQLWNGTKAVTRGAGLGVEGLWQNAPVTRGLTMGVRMGKYGENPLDAYRRTGSSELGRTVREAAKGNPINLGSGIFQSSDAPQEQPGYKMEFSKQLKAGNSLADSVAATDEWAVNKYGTPITDDYARVREATLLAKTVDGKTLFSPTSVGRAAAITVFDPDTIPFMVSSGLVDFGMRISPLDPIAVPMKEFGLWRASKKSLVPKNADDAIRQLETSYLERSQGLDNVKIPDGPDGNGILGRTHPSMTHKFEDGTEVASIQINYPLITDEAHRSFYPGGAPSRFNAPASDPYGAAYDALDDIAHSKYGVSFQEHMYNKYGDFAQQQIEETIQHELVHRAQLDREMVEAAARGERPMNPLDDVEVWHQGIADESVAWHDDVFKQLDETSENIKTAGRDVQAKKQALVDAQRAASEAQKGLGDYGKMDDVQQAAANTKMSKANDAVTKADEAVDMAVAQFGSYTDQHASLKALGQLSSRTEFDAVYRSGLKMMAGESVTAAARKAALREAGLTSKWRPYIKPQMLEDYLTSAKGQRSIRFLAENTSPSQQRRFLNHGIPAEDAKRLLNASSESEVIHVLGPYLGQTILKAPKVGPARAARQFMSNDGTVRGALSNIEFRGGIIDKVDSSWHRLGAKGTDLELNPHDIDSTMDHAEAWLRTIRASDKDVDNVLWELMDQASGPGRDGPPDMTRVYDMLTDIFSRQLDEQLKGQGVDAVKRGELLDEVLMDFKKVVLDNAEYHRDAAGNAVDEVGNAFREVYSVGAGKDIKIPNYSAVLEAQTSMTHMKLPNVRAVRQATSGVHLQTRRAIDAITSKKIFKDEGAIYEYLKKYRGSGLETTWGFGFMEGAHRVWRDLALLRLGWALRVLPEEMVRQAAAGYSSAFTHPIAYLGLMTRHKLANSIVGDDFKSMIQLDDVGAGAFRDPSGAFDASRQSWTTIRHPGKTASASEALAYRRGVATEFMQLSADPIARKVAEVGMEDALIWMRTDEGQTAIRGMKASGDQIDLRTPQGRRLYAERANAMQHQLTGGHWIRKTADGTWKDDAGQVVADWQTMTKQEIVARIDGARARSGQPPVTPMATSYPKEYWIDMAIKETGIPRLDKAQDAGYIVTHTGDADMQRIFANGVDQNGKRIMFDEMKLQSEHDWDVTDFGNRLGEMYDELGVRPPEQVRVPRNALENPRATYDSSVDAIFQSLMAKPSAYLNRNPYFKQRYADDMARNYLFADAELRRHLIKWANDNNYTREFSKSLKQAQGEAGILKMPAPGRKGRAYGMDDLNQLDTFARQRGLKDTKDLFYDLAERNNVTDMMKFVFPFADAWYEVLSRWAGLMFTDATRAPTNWRRAQVGLTNLRKSGFFQEDEYGNETFNWPGAATMAPWMTNQPDNVRMGSNMSLNKMMFIDPNPRGLMMPGVGPMVQSPASMFTFATEQMPEIQNALNWFAYGDFEKGQPQSLGDLAMQWAPSWASQVVKAAFADENRQEFADEIGAHYEMFIQSGNPEFGQETPEQFQHTMEAARTAGTAMSWLKIVDRFFAPATPTYDPELLITQGADQDFWMSSGALARERRSAMEFFDNPDLANKYIEERFGLNPFKIGSDTYQVSEAPMNETAYEYLRSNQEMYDIAPYSMMAWLTLPEGVDDEFFSPARDTAIAEGSTVRVTPEQRAFAINEQLGWHEWNQVRDQAEIWEGQIKGSTQERTDRRTMQMAIVDEWKRRRRDEIYEDHWAWDNQQNRENAGLASKATPEQIWDELIDQGTVGTKSYTYTREISEEMSDWVVEFSRTAQLMFKASLSQGDRNWWLTSTQPAAEQLRKSFVENLEMQSVGMTKGGLAKVAHVLDRWVDPVLTDHEWDEELWLEPTVPDNPPLPAWATENVHGTVEGTTFSNTKKDLLDAGSILP